MASGLARQQEPRRAARAHRRGVVHEHGAREVAPQAAHVLDQQRAARHWHAQTRAAEQAVREQAAARVQHVQQRLRVRLAWGGPRSGALARGCQLPMRGRAAAGMHAQDH